MTAEADRAAAYRVDMRSRAALLAARDAALAAPPAPFLRVAAAWPRPVRHVDVPIVSTDRLN